MIRMQAGDKTTWVSRNDERSFVLVTSALKFESELFVFSVEVEEGRLLGTQLSFKRPM